MPRDPKVGDAVIYHDERGEPHNALIQAVWTPGCVNVVIVNGDEKSQDEYGRQTKHETSVPHVSEDGAHGFYWRFADEAAKPYKKPLQV